MKETVRPGRTNTLVPGMRVMVADMPGDMRLDMGEAREGGSRLAVLASLMDASGLHDDSCCTLSTTSGSA